MLPSEALGGVWRLLPAPSAGSLENAAAWQVSILQTELAQGRVFPARKLASTVSFSFPISTLELLGWPPLMSWSASARESQEAEGRLWAQLIAGISPSRPVPNTPARPRRHTGSFWWLILQRETGNFTHGVVFPKEYGKLSQTPLPSES